MGQFEPALLIVDDKSEIERRGARLPGLIIAIAAFWLSLKNCLRRVLRSNFRMADNLADAQKMGVQLTRPVRNECRHAG